MSKFQYWITSWTEVSVKQNRFLYLDCKLRWNILKGKWIPLLGLPFTTLKCQVQYRGINTGTVTLKHKIGSNPSLEVGRLRLHIWDLMKHDLEEHCWLPNLLETYAEWIRHVSCSQMPKNVIIFCLFFWILFSVLYKERLLYLPRPQIIVLYGKQQHLPLFIFLQCIFYVFFPPVFWGW